MTKPWCDRSNDEWEIERLRTKEVERRQVMMKLSEGRKTWLREQLADKSECQLFSFGMQNDKNCGWDIHGDIIDLLDDNTQLEDENEALKEWRKQAITAFKDIDHEACIDYLDALLKAKEQ